jgi:hypothetical protein
MNDGPFNVWLAASASAVVVGAWMLVAWFRWDERRDRTVDPEYHWKYPGAGRAASVVKLSIRLFVLSNLAAVASVYAWNLAAHAFDPPLLPSPVQDIPLPELWRHPLHHQVSLAWSGLLWLGSAIRCLGSPLYDVFISYKSEDVVLARQIADSLLSAGRRVWFAEYQVLLHRRDRFSHAIQEGIANARFGIALTNDRWAASPHCRFEMEALLKAMGAGRVLEIRVPREPMPHRQHPLLAASPHLESADLRAILEFIGRTTGLRGSVPETSPEGAKRYRATAGGRPCSLAIAGWERQPSSRAAEGSLEGLALAFAPAGGALAVNVGSGAEVSREGQRLDQGIDDRKMFDALVAWAPTHVEKAHAKVRGVHLLFHSGLSQMALTYWTRPHTVDGPAGRMGVGDYWTRKVSLVIPSRAAGQSAEFVFTFGFRGTFADYCRHTHVMDAFARSLEWE